MYSINELYRYLPDLESIPVSKKLKMRGEERYIIEYLDIPLCFDLEAYSFMHDNEKRAVMWAWGLSVGDICFLGRTWQEFRDALDYIVNEWQISELHRCIIWVHNLSYDFQFFRKWCQWENVFPLDSRTVGYALTKEGIEFRCSYILTGKSADSLGHDLHKHDVRKLTGTIDYDIPRHSETVLTDTEKDYLEHDCLVVSAYIEEQIEIENGICNIPLTHTGYCRRYVRRACFRDSSKKAKYDDTGWKYREFMKDLTMETFIYKSCKRAFQGGFTHANPQHVRQVLTNVTSLDVISDYPAQILANLYPVSPPEYIRGFENIELFEEEIGKSCSIFTIELLDVEATINYDHYISRSHCIIPKEAVIQESNGRIVRCSHLITTICNVDYFIIKRCYKFKIASVSGFIKWGWGFLPKAIIESTLYLYEQKTLLKGNKEKKEDYNLLKALLNSIYGMMVTDPLRDRIPYNLETQEWGEERSDGTWAFKIPLEGKEAEEALEKYNKDFNRFTYYPWGIFVTAYARHMLWSGILEFKDDYIYSDTDSIKCINFEKHEKFIDDYNEHMKSKIKRCLEYYSINPERALPREGGKEDGEIKALGTWDKEDIIPGTNYTYTRFKTLGAKRYMVETPDGLHITIAGLSKKDGAKYIKEQSEKEGKDPFEFFEDGMVIPPEHAGKLGPYYGDDEISGVVLDRDHKPFYYHELSYVHMEPRGYSLSMGSLFVTYLDLLQKGYV